MNNDIKRYGFLVVVFYITAVWGCTGILLKTQQGECVYGRTMEFTIPLESEVLFVPRDYAFTAVAPSGKKEGLAWRSTYAVLGINAYHATVFVDGVNEKGLTGGLYYFPGFAEYAHVTQENYAQSLPMWQLLTWLLTTCATVAEVKEAVANILISHVPFVPGDPAPPVHFIIHDRAGNSVVIECMQKGKLFVYDNPLGVIANAPSFDWHLTNMRNYLHLSPCDAKSKMIATLRCASLGNGSGMLGLPGDFTSPSRFIRAAALTHTVPQLSTIQETINQAFHILNSFDIPYGSVIDAQERCAYTQWTSAIDVTNQTLYFHTYHDRTVRCVELKNTDNVYTVSLH